MITARQLREKLANVPDDAIVVVPQFDHNYRYAYVSLAPALKDGDFLTEHVDGMQVNEDSDVQVVNVLVFE